MLDIHPLNTHPINTTLDNLRTNNRNHIRPTHRLYNRRLREDASRQQEYKAAAQNNDHRKALDTRQTRHSGHALAHHMSTFDQKPLLLTPPLRDPIVRHRSFLGVEAR